nr:hypothetical protein [uncultured Bacteroides sp.]
MIIAVDFDGTLHTGEFPAIGEPAKDVAEYMQKLHEDGHYIIIWTCRCDQKLVEAINWLIDNNIPFNRINDHCPEHAGQYPTNPRKVYAHLYVDDRQVGPLPSWRDIYMYASKVEMEYQSRKLFKE